MQMRINFFQDKGQLKDQLIHIQEPRALTMLGVGKRMPTPSKQGYPFGPRSLGTLATWSLRLLTF